MKPVMFCRKTSGIFWAVHSSMKWAALRALSPKSTPLLATRPQGMPSTWAKPVTRVVA